MVTIDVDDDVAEMLHAAVRTAKHMHNKTVTVSQVIRASMKFAAGSLPAAAVDRMAPKLAELGGMDVEVVKEVFDTLRADVAESRHRVEVRDEPPTKG